MKHAKNYAKATVRSDLLVHEHRPRVSVASDQLLHPLHLAGSQHTCSSPSAADFHVPYWRVVDSLLHHSPNAVVNLFHVRVAGWPHAVNLGVSLRHMQLHCLTYTIQCIVLLKDVNCIGDASDAWLAFVAS